MLDASNLYLYKNKTSFINFRVSWQPDGANSLHCHRRVTVSKTRHNGLRKYPVCAMSWSHNITQIPFWAHVVARFVMSHRPFFYLYCGHKIGVEPLFLRWNKLILGLFISTYLYQHIYLYTTHGRAIFKWVLSGRSLDYPYCRRLPWERTSTYLYPHIYPLPTHGRAILSTGEVWLIPIAGDSHGNVLGDVALFCLLGKSVGRGWDTGGKRTYSH